MNNQTEITSEDPKHHWEFLLCSGESVIDFGCAYNSSDDENTRENKLGTPHFIINQEPKKYLGIDLYQPDLDVLKEEFKDNKNVEFINKPIESSAQIQEIFDAFIPTVIKSDIEGAEIHFCNTVPPKELKQIAIESHSYEIENALIEWSKKHGFSVQHVQFLAKYPHIKIYYFLR